MENKDIQTKQEESSKLNLNFNRRNFLVFSGVTAAGLAVGLQGCSDDETPVNPNDGSVDLGSGDIGILNYAYALEQLEAAFYIKVIESKYSGMSPAEQTLLTDIRDHEVAHREFFRAAIDPSKRIPDLEVDFSSIDFTSRASVLGTAKAFEDLGVSAYNGAGHLIKDGAYLLMAGKIVSVEARHAAAIRDLLNPGSEDFAGDGVVDPISGLDKATAPADVLATASKYIKTKITANNLPK